MKDKIFLDANILVYQHSGDENEKREYVNKLLENSETDFYISTQVLMEFTSAMIKRFKTDLKDIRKAVNEYSNLLILLPIKSSTVDYSYEIGINHNFSIWDSLIISTALENQCNILLSEDMHHGHKLGNLKIINPLIHLKNKTKS